MSLLVTKDGLLTTVQDLGRYGYRSYGVNPSGAMDQTATRLLNLLLENDENAPLLEMHFPSGEFLFEQANCFAVGGAHFSPELSRQPVLKWSTQKASAGDVLSFPRRFNGSRMYLAVKGGFDVTPWLGSASTSLVTATGGFEGRRLRIGDRIHFQTSSDSAYAPSVQVGRSLLPCYTSSPKLRVIAGPEFEMLTGLSQQIFLSDQFSISSNSNRMGFRLVGAPLYRLSDSELVSSGTTFGTIQLLPDGQMIVLMADHQTTGGYPRIATIASVDLPLIAQLGPANNVSFEMIDQCEAERLFTKFERDLAYFKTGIRLRNNRL